MDDNELLKNKFQKLHAELVGQDLSKVVDRLFAAAVVSTANMEKLSSWSETGWSSGKSRFLMTQLHKSGHPTAFVELRRALREEDCMRWIVDRLDKLEVHEVHPDSEQPQCPKCVHLQNSSSPVDECAKKDVNILFLGETGVGKSTLINALASHLRFSTFDDAEAAGGFFPVTLSFTVTDPTTYRHRTISTGPYDANESQNQMGGSVTQSPTAYVLELGDDVRVNLIDTPGVSSTDGAHQDKINAHRLLTFISAYEKIDLICVVVKPYEARLTENFKNCLREILRNLHESACDNVVFCVTFCKASNYGPGDTYRILAAFCSGVPKLQDLELSRSTVFCFENETVRYLADCVHDDEQRPSVEQSWRKSAESAGRLVRRAVDVTPHSVVDTLSLNNARRAIVALCWPLVQTAKCVAVNVQELKSAREKVAYCASTDLPGGRVEIVLRRFRFVDRPYSATVCTSSGCCTIDKGIMYERVCHDHCRWSPVIRMCRAFNAAGSCVHCGCSYRRHMWSSCVPEVTFVKVVLNLREIERRKDQSMDEMTRLIDTCAKLSTFLRDNSFFETLGDVISDSVERELDAIGASRSDRPTQIIRDGLDRFLATYRHCVASLKSADQRYSPSDVQEMIDELFTLPINGEELRQGVNVVQRSTDDAVKNFVKKRQKVFNIRSWLLPV